ncbi:type IV secretion system protein VirB10 [Bradyrhizobium sp. CCGUVB23]|uniref:type IV secretion system protein VirB10 n=1 Tax=Bradyrhizobium sp. CCGUVB23 TaxID=2949630 RepID=UPI0020B1EC5E|nr:type IV secretion system protein VirB10 [Bradyrhizobium sp. CCGUVB23]MCP3468660.1 type IV secretion system protein VirB10 [Bradyrhizobium sp. CCGUVB23]
MVEVDPPSTHDVKGAGSLVSDSHRGRIPGLQKIIFVGLVLALSLGLIWFAGSKKNDEASPPHAMIASNTNPFNPPPTDVVLGPPAAPAAAQSAAPPPVPSGPEPNGVRPEETPIFAYSGGDQGISKPVQQVGTSREHERGKEDASLRGQASIENDISMRMKPTLLQPSQATLLPHPDFMITQGTIISCVLQTAIDTNLAGYVKCVLPKDVRGTTGHVVLLDRGTTVVGEIQRGLQQGDARIFVLWSRAETPDHAVISLASPGADELGRSGLPGTVDNHLWERFGGTVFLSVIQGALQAAGSYAASAGGGTSFNSFQSNGEQAADTAIRATINIPPTLKKNQGDTVSIFVARDLDFSNIYQLRMTGQATARRNYHSKPR